MKGRDIGGNYDVCPRGNRNGRECIVDALLEMPTGQIDHVCSFIPQLNVLFERVLGERVIHNLIDKHVVATSVPGAHEKKCTKGNNFGIHNERLKVKVA